MRSLFMVIFGTLSNGPKSNIAIHVSPPNRAFSSLS